MAKTNAERQAGWRMRQREKLDALEVQSMLESDLALAHIRIKALEDIIAADKEQAGGVAQCPSIDGQSPVQGSAAGR